MKNLRRHSGSTHSGSTHSGSHGHTTPMVFRLTGTVALGLALAFSGCGQDSADGFQNFSAADLEESDLQPVVTEYHSTTNTSAELATDNATAEEVTPATEPAVTADTPADDELSKDGQANDTQDKNSEDIATAVPSEGANPDSEPTPDSDPKPVGEAAGDAKSVIANVEKVLATTPDAEKLSGEPGGAASAVSPDGPETPSDSQASLDGEVATAEPRKVEVLIKDREFKKEGEEGALRVSYDDFDLLKVLNMEPVTPDAPDLMPDWLKSLDGKRVRVRGFMFPPFQETGIPVFVLARDNQICCFGRNPKIYDLVEVRMRKGVTANYIQNRPFDVVGIFRIDAESEDGQLYELYKIDDAIVIDK